MDRIVSQLLAELDFVAGQNVEKPVFVIGATNRPDLIDSALLRPGRFDRLVFIGPPEEANEKLRILQALTRKFQMEENLDLMESVILKLSKNLALTGADFYALTVDAMMAAIDRLVADGENSDKIDDLVLIENDFGKALEKLKPSVSEDEMIYYKSLQNKVSS